MRTPLTVKKFCVLAPSSRLPPRHVPAVNWSWAPKSPNKSILSRLLCVVIDPTRICREKARLMESAVVTVRSKNNATDEKECNGVN